MIFSQQLLNLTSMEKKQYWSCNQYVNEKKLLLQDKVGIWKLINLAIEISLRFLLSFIYKAPSLAVEILEPTLGSCVLDMCAAPGMKTVMACNHAEFGENLCCRIEPATL